MNNYMRSAAGAMRSYLRWRRYDSDHEREAVVGYNRIINQDPGRKLDRRTSARIRDYAVEGLGSARFIPWLRTYAAFRGSFSEGLIPDNYFGRFVVPLSIGAYINIEAKTLARRILRVNDELPDLAYFVNGTWMDPDGNQVAAENVHTLLFSKSSVVFAKQDLSFRGRGVFRIASERFDRVELESLGNLVVQAAIQQHSRFDNIVSGSVATVRITTVKANGLPAEKRAAYLRIARNTEHLVSSHSALRVPVIDETGALGDFAAFPDWTICRAHPDTGVGFEGNSVPEFRRAVSFCKKLHDRIPHINVVGWDLAISADGEPVLMEWNADHPDIKFSEASTGPCFVGLGWEKLAFAGRS